MKDQELIDWINNQEYICLDTEARGKYFGMLSPREGLDPYLSEIISLQLGNSKEQHIIFGTPSQDIMLALQNKLCIGHNIKYDYKLLYVSTGIRLENVFDTMIAEKLLNNSSVTIPYGLAAVLNRLFGIKMDKDVRNTFINCVIMDPVQIAYSLEDIKHLDRLYFSQIKRCNAKDMGDLFTIEMQTVKAIAEMELNGMYLNEKDWMDLYERNVKEKEKCEERLNDFLWEEGKYQFFDVVNRKCLVNWDSSKQVIPVFQSFGFDVSSKDHKTGFSIAEKNITKYSGHKFVDLYLNYKGLGKSVSTYGAAFIEKYRNPITGRYHTNIQQTVNTGRSSSSDPNLQNVTVGEIRKCWNYNNTDSNKHYLVCDYSKQELCVLADRAEDYSLMDTLMAEDAHEETARKIFKENYDRKKHRPIGKMVNFAVAYGSTAHALSEGLKVSLEEAQGYIDLFYDAYKGLKPYFDKIYQEALKKRFILLDDITNRKFYIDSFMRADEIKRKCQNYPIQSLSATITKQALVDLYEFTKNDPRIDLLHVQHDEIIFEIRDDYVELEEQVCKIMIEAGNKFLKHMELKVGSMTSKYWDH
jgi:DNA polymerase I